MNLKLTFDGACEPRNPGGHMGIGWVVNGVAHHAYYPASGENTNNVAEYIGINAALEYAIKNPAFDVVEVAGDSQLVIAQLEGEWAVRSPGLYDYYQAAKDKLTQLRQRGTRVSLLWVPRERNAAADAASKEALAKNGVELRPHIDKDLYTRRLGELLLGATCKEKPLSAVRIGKCLDEAGLRCNKSPTELAIKERVAILVNGYFGPEVWWSKVAVRERLQPMLDKLGNP